MDIAEVRRPILVTGSFRSGTTWVGRTIAFDKSVEYISEPFNIYKKFRTRRFKYSFDTQFFYVPNSREEREIYQACWELVASGTNPYFRALTISRQNFDKKTPLRFLKHFVIGLINKKRILVKDPPALLSSGWLYENFQFKVVCIVRNPVAFAGSLKKRNWSFNFNNLLKQRQLMAEKLADFKNEIEFFSNNKQHIVDQACLLWNVLYYIVTEYRDKYPEWLFVRHEDLAKNAISEFQKIFEYLNLEYTGYIKQKIEDFTSDSNDAETDNSFFKARDSKGSLETWKSRLTPSEVDKVIDQTRHIAANFYTILGKEYT
jgi:hypothetical protein